MSLSPHILWAFKKRGGGPQNNKFYPEYIRIYKIYIYRLEKQIDLYEFLFLVFENIQKRNPILIMKFVGGDGF